MTDTAESAPPRRIIGPPCFASDGQIRLRYAPFPPSPRQAAFLSLICRDALFGGMVGGGKSLTLLLAALQFCDVPGYNALLCRRTIQDLEGGDSLIPLSKWLLEGKGPTYNANKRIWTFPTNGAPATLRFGYLKNPGDHLQYQGHQYQFIGFDEMTQFPDRDAVLYLFSRLRRIKLSHDQMIAVLGQSSDGLTLADVPLRFRGATNPGGPGAWWVKPRYVDPETAQAPFLRSSFRDNPGMPDDEIREMLAELSEVERRRLELGDWDVVEVAGALWRFKDIKRVGGTLLDPTTDQQVPRLNVDGTPEPPMPEFEVIAVGVDPSVSEGTGDECGIVVGGLTASREVVILDDASGQMHPDDWAQKAVLTYHSWGATRMVIEENQGGGMNRSTIHNAADRLGVPRPNVILVRANPGESKELRAQQPSQAYRAGKVAHGPLVRDSVLEGQMVSWVPGDKLSITGSPDRVDAMVWLVQHLLFGKGGTGVRTSARTALTQPQSSARRNLGRQ